MFHPNTVDACFAHDGHGLCGGTKDENGNWNTAAHKDRIVEITDKELQVLSDTFEDGTTGDCAKLVNLHNVEMVSIFENLSANPTHFKDYNTYFIISRGFEETSAVKEGIIRRDTCNVETDKLVISGPHFYLANPINKNPRKNCKLNSDYDSINLNEIAENYLPRTNYVPCMELSKY